MQRGYELKPLIMSSLILKHLIVHEDTSFPREALTQKKGKITNIFTPLNGSKDAVLKRIKEFLVCEVVVGKISRKQNVSLQEL